MAMATTSVRSVNHYRDPSLDGLIGQENNTVRGSSYRRDGARRRSYSSDNTTMPLNLPEAPEIPRGPPISYRATGQETAMPQRSFSQRAKERPFLKEAFADDETLNNGHTEYVRSQPADSQSRDPETSARNEPVGVVNAPLHLNTSVSGGRPTRQVIPSNTSPLESPPSARRSKAPKQRTRRVSDTSQFTDEPISSASRPTAGRDTSNMLSEDQRRDWASDRSPLQKLEVTLNDISKEEKRARVEEAEMLLRESKAGRGGQPSSRVITPATMKASAPIRISSNRSTTTPAERKNLEEAGLVRSLSSTQRDRLQHSTTVASRKPDIRRLSGDGRRGFDYEEQQYGEPENTLPVRGPEISPSQPASNVFAPEPYPDVVSRKRVSSVRQKAALDSLPDAAKQHERGQREANTKVGPPQAPSGSRIIVDQPREDRSPDTNTRFPQHNPVWQTNSHSAAHSVPSNITRAVSMQQQKPPPQFVDDKEVVRSSQIKKDFNSSHKAALADAAIVGAAASIAEPTRSNTRKLQKAPPPGYERTKIQSIDQSYPSDFGADQVRSHKSQEIPQKKGTVTDEGPIAQYYRTGVPRDAKVQRDVSQRVPKPIGLGLQDTLAASDGMGKPLPPAPPLQRPRQQSVSFKEPFDRARPVDEWRHGGVARLSLADFALDEVADATKDKAWWEAHNAASARRKKRRSSAVRAAPGLDDETVVDDRRTEFKPHLFLKCGPLLRYTGMRRTRAEQSEGVSSLDHEVWRGSVLIVTQDAQSSYERVPTLRLFSQPKRLLPPPPQRVAGEELAPEYVDPIAGLTKMSRTGKVLYLRPVDHLDQEKDLSRIEDDNGLFETSPSPLDFYGSKEATAASTNKRTMDQDGERLGKFQEVKGVRLYADPIRGVTFWRFTIEIELGDSQEHIAYRINHGPSVGFWVPARGQSMNIMFHSCNGFSLSVSPDLFSGPDPLWRDVLNTHQTNPFHVMIGGGDQVYNDRVMIETHHFGDWTKLRNPQHKHDAPFTPEMRDELETFYLERYSMWFSQGLFGLANSQIPMVNVWDDHDIIDGFGSYPDHFMRSPVFSGLGGIAFKYYMLFQHQSVVEETSVDEPSWLLGAHPGPYIAQKSRSLFMHLGKHVAFLGLDCRTERQKDEILTDETYEIVLQRCRKEIIEGETKHLIVLLGVPIAYPRLVWLENVLTSRAMDPIKALGRIGMLKTGFLNKFDGGVEILDDLDDHWTAKHHKEERNNFIEELQDLAAEKSVRITILGGDVHLAAIGQFYSNPKLKIPKDKDHRYMPNVISSAIVNTPPPELMGDIINKRNKVHHLDKYTDEDMIPMFTHDVDEKRRNNKHLLPRRNWCSIREYQPGSTPPPTPPETPSASGSESEEMHEKPQRRFSFSREDMNPQKLIRRISQRRAPPTSYRNTIDYSRPDQSVNSSAPNQQRPVSLDPDCPVHGENGRHSQTALPSQRQTSFDSSRPEERPASFEHSSSGAPVRPGNFRRRPTNLSEKAARKGIVPALDAEGNEIDINDQINLEGGLDIILNCEINQKDPAGITTPYRLLVPALWYDGSSDREKLDDPKSTTPGFQRKPTLLKRFGIGNKAGGKDASNRGPGTWDQDVSDEENYSEGEEEHEPAPRRLFGLFGSRHRRDDRDDRDDHYENEHEHVQRPAMEGNQPASDRLFDSENHPPAHHPSAPSSREQYVIGSAPRNAQRDVRGPNSNPHQPAHRDDALYAEPQQNVSRQRSSKQERVLGIGSDRDQFQHPEETQPRGDGIIGRGYNEPLDYQNTRESEDRPSHDGQGYSGVEAYREPKARNRWSLRAAREWAREGTKWE